MIEAWLGDASATAICVVDEAAVSQVREAVREVGHAQGMDTLLVERAVAAASELGHNQRLHAGGGMVVVRACSRGTVGGVEVVAADRGPGILDPKAALGGVSTTEPARSSLGIGLAAAHRLSDEMDVDVRLGEGSCFWLRKFAEPVARGREVAVWGRPKDGERVSGDDGAFVRTDEGLLIVIADGLGHGTAARDSSSRVARIARSEPNKGLEGLLHASDTALSGLRGAAVTVALVHEHQARVDCAAVGNVMCAIERRDRSSKFGSEQWTLGVPAMRRKVRVEQQSFPANSLLLLQSDGVSARATLSAHPDLFVDHPLIVAHFIATTFGRGNDDVTVAVVR